MANFFKSNALEKSIFLYFFLIFLLCITIQPLRIHHDAAILLETGQLLWEGQMPYIDFIELDPPMIMYFNAIPAGIANLISLNPIPVLLIFVTIMTFWCAIALKNILIKANLNIKDQDAYSLSIALLIFSLWVYKNNDFGQRDYLFIITFIPYLSSRYVRNESGYLSKFNAITAGVLCGICASFKQYYILVLITPEIYYFFKKKSFNQIFSYETISLALVMLIYLLHFFFLPTLMTKTYFSRWAPLLIHNYDTYDATFSDIWHFHKYSIAFLIVLSVSSIIFIKFYKTEIKKFLPLLFFTFISCFSIYFIQHKGFSYQLIPAFGILAMMLGIAFIEIFAFFESITYFRKSIYFLICITLFVFIIFHIKPKKYLSPFEQTILKYSKKNDRILFITTSINVAYPIIVQLDRLPGSRYLSSFPIAFFVKKESGEKISSYKNWDQLPENQKQFIEELLSDVNKFHPKIIFIDNNLGCQGCPKNFIIYPYLEHLGFINQILKNYTKVSSVNGYVIFVLSNQG